MRGPRSSARGDEVGLSPEIVTPGFQHRPEPRSGFGGEPKSAHDVELNVRIELGRARLPLDRATALAEGSVVELDKMAGELVDVFVNDRLAARGQVLVVNDSFCVRVCEIVAGDRVCGQE